MPPPVHTAPQRAQEQAEWSRRTRLLIISLAAPLLVHIAGSIIWSPILLFVAIVSYPIMVVVTATLLLILHFFFREGLRNAMRSAA